MYKNIATLCEEHKHLCCNQQEFCIQVGKKWYPQHKNTVGVNEAISLLTQRVNVWLYLMCNVQENLLTSDEFKNRFRKELESL